jgi:hypothetical protein
MDWLRPVTLLLLLCLLAGCSTSPVQSVTDRLFGDGEDTEEVVHQNPIEKASSKMTQYGVACIVLGLVFGAFTSFRTGWGTSLAAAGALMLLLAWAFAQPWVPWIGLSTVIAYAGYKVYNWGSNKQETEHPLM